MNREKFMAYLIRRSKERTVNLNTYKDRADAIKKSMQGAKQRVGSKSSSAHSSAYGKEYELDLEWAITELDRLGDRCPVTGIEFFYDKSYETHGKSGHPAKPSIDRIDSSLGYTKDNSRIVSNLANKMKSSWTDEEIQPFLKGIAKRHGIFSWLYT